MRTAKVFPLIIVAFIFLSSVAAEAGEISISAEVSLARIPFSGRDTLTVRLIWEGESSAYQIEDFPMPVLEKLKILGSSTSVSSAKDSSVASGERTTRTYSYILEPIDFGIGIVQPMTLIAKNRSTQVEHILHTGRLTVEIAKPIATRDKSGNSFGFFVILGGAIVVLSVTGFVLIRRKKGSRLADNEKLDENRYQDRLLEIKKETVADGKRFYSRVFRLLLQYLEKECRLEISGKTGEQVLEIVGGMVAEEDRVHIMHFLNEALEVKYRPQEPTPGDIADTYNALHGFFERKLK
ncbi:MAG: hypothetical protein GY841_00480 [FCB group bacterium]|nr:hypothetical protein [FCB group bacterium]